MSNPSFVPLQREIMRIGLLGHGGAGLSPGHSIPGMSSFRDQMLAIRMELDQLYYKLAMHPDVGGNWGYDDGSDNPSTPHQRLFIP